MSCRAHPPREKLVRPSAKPKPLRYEGFVLRGAMSFGLPEQMAIPNFGVRLAMRHFLKVSDQASLVFAEIKHDQPRLRCFTQAAIDAF